MEPAIHNNKNNNLLWSGYIPAEIGDEFRAIDADGTFTVVKMDTESAYYEVEGETRCINFDNATICSKCRRSQYKVESRYVRTGNPLCPLEEKLGCIYPDGRFRTNQKFYEQHEYFLNPGFLVVLIKDKTSDWNETKAAYESVVESLRACFNYCGSDVPVNCGEVAILDELKYLFEHTGQGCSHIILVGHGSSSGIVFFDRLHSADEISDCFNVFKKEPKQLISLCCHSGCASMASQISESTGVSHVLAPEQEIANYYAAHFILGYLINFFFESDSIAEAVDRAKIRANRQNFVLWENGKRQ